MPTRERIKEIPTTNIVRLADSVNNEDYSRK